MKIARLVTLINTVSLAVMFSALAQGPTAVDGKIVETTTKMPIGAFTVKAFPTPTTSETPPAQTTTKPLAQTLTRADGTYSLTVPTGVQSVVLKFEKLSYFSIPPQELVQVTPPKTIVPDVAAMKYSRGQSISTYDLVDAFNIRKASSEKITNNLPPVEREAARQKWLKSDFDTLQKAGVDSKTIATVKEQLLIDANHP